MKNEPVPSTADNGDAETWPWADTWYVAACYKTEEKKEYMLIGISKSIDVARSRIKEADGLGCIIPVIKSTPLAKQVALLKPDSPGIWWEWAYGRFAVVWEPSIKTEPGKDLFISAVFENGVDRGMYLDELDPNCRWTKIEPLNDKSRLREVSPTSRLQPAYCPYCDNYFPIERNRNAEFAAFHVLTCKYHPMRAIELKSRKQRELLDRASRLLKHRGDKQLADEIDAFLDSTE